MSKRLYVSEKPSVAREIAGVIDEPWVRHDGYWEGPSTIVTWATGHLVEMSPPEAYDPAFKKWRMTDLPILPGRFQISPTRGKKQQLDLIRKLMRRKDVGEIVNACDAGREGELIFAWIHQWSAPSASTPVLRLWLSSLTATAIEAALADLRPAEEFAPLQAAARARAAADWAVGMNATRVSTMKFRPVLDGVASVGRVQTPTLAIIVDRELQIRAFSARERWTVEGAFSDVAGVSYAGRWQGPDGEFLDVEAQADALRAVVEAAGPGTLVQLADEVRDEPPPALYDLTTLQRDANKRWRWPAKRTLAVAQELYERYKAITYPRTDSQYLSADVYAQMPQLFAHLREYEPYPALLDACLPAPVDPSRVCDDARVSDHHAILPTDAPQFGAVWSHDVVDLANDLPEDHYKLYDLVVRRTIAAWYPNARIRHLAATTAITAPRTAVDAIVANDDTLDRELLAGRGAGAATGEGVHHFLTKGKGIAEPGWRTVYGQGAQPDRVPALTEGVLAEQAFTTRAGKTKPPKRYTEGTLLAAMESAGNRAEEAEVREAMKERGLGTPATRAAIIERLIDVGYIRRARGELHATDKGLGLISLLAAQPVTSAALTGEWEARLRAIERGEDDLRAFWADIRAFVSATVTEISQVSVPEPEGAPEPLGTCPGCGAPVRETPRAWSCWRSTADPGCGFAVWKTLSGRAMTEEEARTLVTGEDLPTMAFPGSGSVPGNGTAFEAPVRVVVRDQAARVVVSRPRNDADYW